MDTYFLENGVKISEQQKEARLICQLGTYIFWLIKRHGFRVLQMTGKIYVFTNIRTSVNEASMRERRETLSFLSFLARRERPLLAGKSNLNIKLLNSGIPSGIC